MPVFEIEHPDGRTFEVDAPDMRAAEEAIGQVPHGKPISQLSALGHGLASGATFGFSDEIAGLMRSSGLAALRGGEGGTYDGPMPTDQEITKAYSEGRDVERERQKAAQEQFPKTYMGGEIAGGVAAPIPVVGGATLPARIARSAAVGAGAGALSGAGQGETLEDRALRAAGGGVAGLALGGAAAPVAEGVGQVASKVAAPLINTVRGATSPREEAARQVVTAIERDIKADPNAERRLTAQEFVQARQEGQPVKIADVGGDLTRRLADVSAITSPEGGTTLRSAIDQRFEDQAGRLSGSLRDLAADAPTTLPQPVRFGQIIRGAGGGSNAARDLEDLQQAARAANRPAYQRAYQAGDREIWSPELERLTSAPSIRQAMQAAVNKWKDWQVVDGFGGANPGAMVENGMVNFSRGRFGVPTFPNLQFWDYTARNIADKAEAARRSGRTQLAAQLGGLERQIKSELDRIVPEYRSARTGAAQFFGANDALEAGQLFVRSNADIGQARQALNRMSAPEREMFARGFSSELADQVERAGDDAKLLTSPMFSSEAGRQRMQLALGPQRAQQFEQQIASDRLFHQFGQARSAFEAGQNFVGGGSKWRSGTDVAATRRSLSQMSDEEREAFRSGYANQFIAKLGNAGDRRNILNQISQSPAARAEVRMALGQDRANELESRLRVEGIMDLVRNAVTGNSWTARRLYDVGLAGGAGLGLTEAYNMDPKGMAVAGMLAALSSGGKKVNSNVMRHVAELLTSSDIGQLAKGVKIVSRNPRLLDALRATDKRLASVAGEQAANLPAVQAGGVSRAEGNQDQVPRPPAQ